MNKLEINALIAENIMGWEQDDLGGFWTPDREFAYLEGECWNPSSDMRDTLWALEKFSEYEVKKYGRNKYRVTIYHNDVAIVEFFEIDLPMAICLTMLKAVGM